MFRTFLSIILLLLVSACATSPEVYNGPIVSKQKISSREVEHVTTSEEKYNIAVIVPMGKQKEQIGASILKAAQLAIENSHDPSSNLVLLNSDLIAADPAMLKATLKASKVKAIIGPVYSKETESLEAMLAGENVTILSLSNDSSIKGDSLLMMGISPDAQASTITRYAIGQGVHKFHLLIPSNKYGKLINNSVAHAVSSKSNVNYEVVWYSPENESQIINALVAKLADEDELEGQAIFMPQGGNNILMLNTALEKHKLKIKLIGSSSWDNPNILNFPMFNSALLLRRDLHEERVSEEYQRAFGSEPNNIDIIAYNSLSMIIKMHKQALEINKQSIIAANPERFDASGASLHSFSVLEVEKGSFKLLDVVQ